MRITKKGLHKFLTPIVVLFCFLYFVFCAFLIIVYLRFSYLVIFKGNKDYRETVIIITSLIIGYFLFNFLEPRVAKKINNLPED